MAWAGARLRVLSAVKRGPWLDGAVEDELRLLAGHAAAAGLLGARADIGVETGDAAAYLLDGWAEVGVLVCGGRGYGAAEIVLQGGLTRRLTAAARRATIVLHVASRP